VVNDAQEAAWEGLALRGANGDEAARRLLTEQLWPVWIQRVRSRKALRLLGGSEDHVHNVVARLVQKLLDPRVLQSFEAWRQSATNAAFRGWLLRVTDNEVHDYVRGVAGRVVESDDDGSADEPSPKLLLNEFSGSSLIEQFGQRPPNTEFQTALELVRFAETCLPDAQTRALSLWLQGASDDDVDVSMSLERGVGRALRRAAIARLRREFGQSADGGEEEK
jgi:DNA-directed RNA polymerase specialized sigma24 family protein